MRALLCSAVLVVVTAGAVEAQVCVGQAPFANGPYRVSGMAQFTDGAQGFAGGFTAGGAAAFGGITLGTISYDDFDGSTTALGATAGYEFALGAARTLQLCPIVSGTYGFGPDNIEGSGIDMSSYALEFGLSLGGTIQSSPQLQIVPAGGVSLAYSEVKLEGSAGSLEGNDTFGIASFGVGFVLNRTITIQPGVAMPFGLEENDPTFALLVSLGFGRRP